MRIILHAILLSAFTSSLVYAADVDGVYSVEGIGVTGCASFIESVSQKNNKYYIYAGWLEGHLTAQNRLQNNTFDISPWQSTELLLKIIESICVKNPELKFYQVVDVIVAGLLKQKLDSASEFKNVGSLDNPLVLQAEVIKRIQQVLTNKGFNVGPIDGAYGGSSQAAMKSFQSSRGLGVTGLPDQISLFELFKPEE